MMMMMMMIMVVVDVVVVMTMAMIIMVTLDRKSNVYSVLCGHDVDHVRRAVLTAFKIWRGKQERYYCYYEWSVLLPRVRTD